MATSNFEVSDDLTAHLSDDIRIGAFEMSNRKPFNDCAGYVASRKNTITGIHNVIYIASEQGVDAEHKYITVCEAHHTMVSIPNIPQARIAMKDATSFCESCRQLSGIV